MGPPYRYADPVRSYGVSRIAPHGRVGYVAPAGRGGGPPGVRPRDTYRRDDQGETADQSGSERAVPQRAPRQRVLEETGSWRYAHATPVPVQQVPVKPGPGWPPQTPGQASHGVAPGQDGVAMLVA